MIGEGRGRYARGEGLLPAPYVRVGVGFGKDRVAAASALVDTGADVCLFPAELLPWALSGLSSAEMVLTPVGDETYPVTVYYPTVTVGTIRVEGVACAVLPGVDPLLGRSFLNHCEVLLSAPKDVVRLRRET
jgi:predicted aspartyl protease